MCHFIFRYFSNRGTDRRIAIKLSQNITNAQAMKMAIEWAEKVHSELHVMNIQLPSNDSNHCHVEIGLRNGE